VCWSRGVHGAARQGSALLATSPSPVLAAKSIRRLVFDLVNLTCWSFCFEADPHLAGGIVIHANGSDAHSKLRPEAPSGPNQKSGLSARGTEASFPA
jgi:hypothetical protein